MEETGVYKVEHSVASLFKLCLDCEDYTGKRAVRQITLDGKCATCGSSSVMKMTEYMIERMKVRVAK